MKLPENEKMIGQKTSSHSQINTIQATKSGGDEAVELEEADEGKCSGSLNMELPQ